MPKGCWTGQKGNTEKEQPSQVPLLILKKGSAIHLGIGVVVRVLDDEQGRSDFKSPLSHGAHCVTNILSQTGLPCWIVVRIKGE